RHAADAGDWQLAARTVLDELAVAQLIEPRDGEQLAAEFSRMPDSRTLTEPQPLLVEAAIELSRGRDEASAASLGAAESMLELLPAGAEAPSRLAAALVRFALSRRTAISTPQRSRSAQPRTCSRPCPRTWLPATASCALRYCPAAAWWNSGGAVSMRLTRA